jgi:raffinose/stachyose/melibiose transport system permease protein
MANNRIDLKRESIKWGWFALFIIPAVLIYTLFVIYPVVNGTLILSFQKWNPIRRKSSFVGLDNFINLFQDKTFYSSLGATMKYVISVVIRSNILALVLVLAIESARFNVLFRNVFFIPHVVSGLIVGYLWRFMFIGVYPNLMTAIGLPEMASFTWYSDVNASFIAALIMPGVWKGLGFLILLYIAGLQAIPNDVIEASVIDGANIVQQKLRIVIPMLMSTISINLFLSIADAFKQFELAYITNGGPGTSSMLFSYYIFNAAFSAFDYGQACAMALILMIVIGFFTFTQLRLTSRKEVEL